jgi:Transposase
MSGSEGGPGRRTSGNVRTAPRTRPYWATDALDKVRREIWNQIRRAGHKAAATELKGSRWVLLKNAQDLTANEAAKLALVAKLNAPLYRAYLLLAAGLGEAVMAGFGAAL